eukprot:1616522-Alexandrium_andersonii.AAC.1
MASALVPGAPEGCVPRRFARRLCWWQPGAPPLAGTSQKQEPLGANAFERRQNPTSLTHPRPAKK